MTKWTIGDRRIGSEVICFHIVVGVKGSTSTHCSSTGLKASAVLASLTYDDTCEAMAVI
jgi:hypothetical protein